MMGIFSRCGVPPTRISKFNNREISEVTEDGWSNTSVSDLLVNSDSDEIEVKKTLNKKSKNNKYSQDNKNNEDNKNTEDNKNN